MSYEPTDAEVEALRALIAQIGTGSYTHLAAQLACHFEPRDGKQRCDGSGELKVGFMNRHPCSGCIRCAPKVTPKSDAQYAWLRDEAERRRHIEEMRKRHTPAAESERCEHPGIEYSNGWGYCVTCRRTIVSELAPPTSLNPTQEDFMAFGWNTPTTMFASAMTQMQSLHGLLLVQIRDLLVELGKTT